MRPLRLVLENVNSFRGEHSFDFRGVNLAVLSGPNGAGKSTIASDAPRWALFGTTRGGADSVINDQEDRCRVELEFALGDQRYLVSRQRSRKGGGKTLLTFHLLDGDTPVVLDGANVAETQRRIEQTLHMTDALFVQTACADQGHASRFSEATPGERKAVLSEILGLTEWERRAEVARRLVRDVTAHIARLTDQRDRAEGLAAEANGLREELSLLLVGVGHAEMEIGRKQTELDKAQEAKQGIIRDREADKAERQRLAKLGEDVEAAEAEVATLESKLKRLREDVEGVEKLAGEVEQAEAAQAGADELEEKREKHDALQHESDLVRQELDAAVAERAQEIRALEGRIDQARSAHERDVDGWRQRVKDLTAQAEPLERVPCAGADLEGQCPLIEAALEAKAVLPKVEAELAAALELDPGAMDAEHLAELKASNPNEREALRILDIGDEREALAYDAAEHKAAKDAGARLPELLQKQAQVEAAEAQIAETEASFKKAQANADLLAGQEWTLSAKLGEARDWAAALADVEGTMRAAGVALGHAREQLQELQREQGSLAERLRAATAAAAEAEELVVELRQGEKRLKLLKILAQVFGKTGIPALLMEQAIPELEATANEVLSWLSDGRMSLALESLSETQSGALRETLDITVNDVRGPRPYDTFSGGEQMRVNLGLRIGLSILLANRAGARIETLILDEPAGALDTEGRMLFLECVQKMTERFATIFVISHIEQLQDAFPFRFHVTPDGDGSKVELIAA